MLKNLSVLLLLKKDKAHNSQVIRTLKKYKNIKLSVCIGSRNSSYPRKLIKKRYDFIVSYLSPWIVPIKVLKRTKYRNINFHPSLPKYPGFGCYNLCIYNNDKFYGVTCHEMEKKIDSGKILFQKKINIRFKSMIEFYLYIYEKAPNYIIQSILNLKNQRYIQAHNKKSTFSIPKKSEYKKFLDCGGKIININDFFNINKIIK